MRIISSSKKIAYPILWLVVLSAVNIYEMEREVQTGDTGLCLSFVLVSFLNKRNIKETGNFGDSQPTQTAYPAGGRFLDVNHVQAFRATG